MSLFDHTCGESFPSGCDVGGLFFSTFWRMGETNSRVGLIVMFKGDKTTLEVGTPPCKKMGVPFG